MHMLPLLVVNRCLPLLHMATCFIWINVTKKRIIEFAILYMINPGLNVDKSFRHQLENIYL